jgi:hypothetical protein
MKISLRKRIMLNVALVVTLLTIIYSGLLLRQQHQFITELAISEQDNISAHFTAFAEHVGAAYNGAKLELLISVFSLLILV